MTPGLDPLSQLPNDLRDTLTTKREAECHQRYSAAPILRRPAEPASRRRRELVAREQPRLRRDQASGLPCRLPAWSCPPTSIRCAGCCADWCCPGSAACT